MMKKFTQKEIMYAEEMAKNLYHSYGWEISINYESRFRIEVKELLEACPASITSSRLSESKYAAWAEALEKGEWDINVNQFIASHKTIIGGKKKKIWKIASEKNNISVYHPSGFRVFSVNRTIRNAKGIAQEILEQFKKNKISGNLNG